MKKRSVQYPNQDLFVTRNFAVGVYDAVGDTVYMKAEDLAQYGGVAKRDADNFAVAAKLYGWMSFVKGQGYVPIAAKCKILRRMEGDEAKSIYQEAFTTPSLYRLLIEKINGEEIKQDGLEILLTRDHGYTDAGARNAVSIFIQNAKGLGLVDEGGHLNMDADMVISPPSPHASKSNKPKPPNQKTASLNSGNKQKTTPPPPPPKTPPSGEPQKINITVLVGEIEITVPIPLKLNLDDVAALIKHFQKIQKWDK